MRNILKQDGFTLIELLVVVLIIGILAAIALPQYNKVILKSRVAEARVILKTLVDAGDLWILQNGGYSLPDMDELEVDVPVSTDYWEFEFDESDSNGCSACAASVSNNFGDFSICYTSPHKNDDFAGKWWCSASDEEGSDSCRKLNGRLMEGYDEVYELP